MPQNDSPNAEILTRSMIEDFLDLMDEQKLSALAAVASIIASADVLTDDEKLVLAEFRALPEADRSIVRKLFSSKM